MSTTESLCMEVFDSALAKSILSYCDVKTRHCTFALLNKRCYERFVSCLLVYSSDEAQHSALPELDGNMIKIITNQLKIATLATESVGLSDEASFLLRETNNLDSIYEAKMIQDIYRLTGAVYTNWDCSPYDANRGVFHEFHDIMEGEEFPPEVIKAVEDDVQYWKTTRIFDYFMILFDRPDGTIVVSSNLKKVYLVVGLNPDKSLGEEANLSMDLKRKAMYPNIPYSRPKLYGPVLGTRLGLTLVNWKGKITYDNTIRPVDKGNPAHIRYALKAYKKALEKGTIIHTLTKGQETPLDLIRSNPIVSKELLAELKESLANELNLIQNFLFKTNHKKDLPWIFCNEGWSEEKQSHTMRIHVTDTHAIPGIPIGQKNANIQDIVKAIFEITFSAHKLPWGIVIDDPEHLYILKALIEPHIMVTYKPPISAENQFLEDELNRKRCPCCLCITCPDGKPLLRCSKCQQVFYCCVEHQKQDWKLHKLACK